MKRQAEDKVARPRKARGLASVTLQHRFHRSGFPARERRGGSVILRERVGEGVGVGVGGKVRAAWGIEGTER